MEFHKKNGFTLVEMLTVLFIVSILAGIVLGVARYAAERARVSRAESDLYALSGALDNYFLVFGDYPDVESVTNLITFSRETLNGDGDEYEFKNLLPQGFTAVDPWKHPYVYNLKKPYDDVIYDISSKGPDGKEGTSDDICTP